MATLPSNDNLQGLDGWGSFTKSIRGAVSKAVSQVTNVTKAVVAPTSSNLKRANTTVAKPLASSVSAAAKASTSAMKAVVVPTKRNARQAVTDIGKSKIATTAVTVGAAMLTAGQAAGATQQAIYRAGGRSLLTKTGKDWYTRQAQDKAKKEAERAAKRGGPQYLDEYGNPISKAEYDRRLKELTGKTLPDNASDRAHEVAFGQNAGGGGGGGGSTDSGDGDAVTGNVIPLNAAGSSSGGSGSGSAAPATKVDGKTALKYGAYGLIGLKILGAIL